MDVKPIRNENDYDQALADIDRVMGASAGTPQGDRLDVLVTLVEAYERANWPIDAPDPIEAIRHVMTARNLRQKDLAVLIGSQPRASEVLSRRRPLTLAMIRALSAAWNLPADVLVAEYPLEKTAASSKGP